MTTHDRLLTQIEKFLKSHDMAPTRFGSLAIGDANLVLDLRKGERDLKTSTVDRVESFMRTFKGEQKPRRGRPPICNRVA